MTLNFLLVVLETLQDANSIGVMSYLLINGTWLPVGLILGKLPGYLSRQLTKDAGFVHESLQIETNRIF